MNAISVFRWAGEEEQREPKDVDESLSLPQKKLGRLFEACLDARGTFSVVYFSAFG